MFSKKIWFGFIIVIIAYGLVMQEGEGMHYLIGTPQLVKHIIHFLFLLFFAGVGVWSWYNYKQKWVVKLWIILYGIAAILLVMAGFISIIFKIQSLSFKYLFGNFRLFFTSPVPFGICLILSKIDQART